MNEGTTFKGLLLKVWISPNGMFLDYEYNISKYDLSIVFLEADDGADFVLEYAAALIKPETIDTLFFNYKAIIMQVLDNKSIVLGDMETSYNT